MTEAEQRFLALLAIGVFSIDQEGGIWRHREMVAGSWTGGKSVERDIPARRAETTHTKGHLRVQMLREDGTKLLVYAHRVVWMVKNQAEIPEGLEINHKDGRPSNNHPDNLELITRRGNVIHAMRVLGKMRREGSHNAAAKLTPTQVLDIRDLCDRKVMPQRLIALQFGVSTRTVQDIYNRDTWKHL